MSRPRTDEVRWLLFTDDELKELQIGLERIEDGGDNTTEGDCLLIEIKEEQENRERTTDGYVHYLREE